MAETKKQKRDYMSAGWVGAWGVGMAMMTLDATKAHVAAEAQETVDHIQSDAKLGVTGQVRKAGHDYVGATGKVELKQKQFFTNAELITEQNNIVSLRNQENDVNGSMLLMGTLGAACLYSAAHEVFANSALMATVKATPGKWGRAWLAHTVRFDRDIS